MVDAVVGSFSSVRLVDGRYEESSTWCVKVDSPSVARDVSRILGGAPSDSQARRGGQWEIVTKAIEIPVLAEDLDDDRLAFRLFDHCDVGVFFFPFGVWSREEVAGRLSLLGPCRDRCVLSIKPVEFKTRTGLTVLYRLPFVSASALQR